MRVYKRYKDAKIEDLKTDTDLSVFKNPKSINQNIMIVGNMGTGKTHIAYSIVNSMCEQYDIDGVGYYTDGDVEYTTIKEIIENIRNSWRDTADKYDYEIVNRYKTVQLLIVDEIGVQYGTESERIELFDIFDSRYKDMLPIIAISNLNRQQLADTLGARIIDRLLSGAKIVEMKGKSRR